MNPEAIHEIHHVQWGYTMRISEKMVWFCRPDGSPLALGAPPENCREYPRHVVRALRDLMMFDASRRMQERGTHDGSAG